MLILKRPAAALTAVLFFVMASTTSVQAASSNPSDVRSVASATSDFEGEWTEGMWHSLCKSASGRAKAEVDGNSIDVEVVFKGKKYDFNADIKDFADGQLKAKGQRIKYTASLTEDGALHLFYERRTGGDCGVMLFNSSKTAAANNSPSGTWTGHWYSTESNQCKLEGGEKRGDVAIDFTPAGDTVIAHFDVDNAEYKKYSRIFESVGGTLKNVRVTAKKSGGAFSFEEKYDEFVIVENGNEEMLLSFEVPGRDCGYMKLHTS